MADSFNIEKKRIDKVKLWFKDPYHIALVLILLLAFAVRLYFHVQAQDQALWWDEAEYMSTAKHWAFNVPYELNPQRPPLFQFLAALAFIVGLGEGFVKFAFSLLPSLFLVFAIYLLGKEMFDKKIGLIAAFLASISWTFLFWTARVQPDFFSMSFQVLSVLFMWKHWKQASTKLVILSGVFVAIGFYFKISALLVPIIFIVFILIKDRVSAIKDRHYWIFAISFILALVPYFIWSYATFATPTAFTSGYIEPVPKETPFGWYNLNFYSTLTTPALPIINIPGKIFDFGLLFQNFFPSLFFILFIIGFIYSLKFLVYADLLIKDKKKCFDSNVFSVLSLIVISAFYIFHIKNTDDRWVFLWMPFIFFLIGNALMLIFNNAKKYTKTAAFIIIIILLIVGAYAQYTHANALIKSRTASYGPVKDAGLWIKENSNKDDKVLSISYTQSVYYTERNVSSYSLLKNESALESYLRENKPRFMGVSLFEPHPGWSIQQGRQNGYDFILMPYFNSTIVLQNGKVVSIDLKPDLQKNDIKFKLVYPQKELNGMFVYEIGYN